MPITEDADPGGEMTGRTSTGLYEGCGLDAGAGPQTGPGHHEPARNSDRSSRTQAWPSPLVDPARAEERSEEAGDQETRREAPEDRRSAAADRASNRQREAQVEALTDSLGEPEDQAGQGQEDLARRSAGD
ncbi:hypothetical protein QJS66_02405 [Kocuria rhizophila]|nr:hypothetical protein QJS66_02405 [Kocuria rhizophila]